MDKLFKYYALDGSGIQGANKRPISDAFDSAETAFKISAFCLETAIPGLYRLLAKNPTNIQKYHYFNIQCPNCGSKLEEIMPARDKHVLPMYACTCCNR